MTWPIFIIALMLAVPTVFAFAAIAQRGGVKMFALIVFVAIGLSYLYSLGTMQLVEAMK